MSDSAEIVFDDAQWQAVLKKVRKKWDDIKSRKEFGGVISSVVFSDIMEHFEKQVGPDGPWAQRKEPYKTFIESLGKKNILQVSGDLRKSLMPTEGKFRSNSSGVIFYSNLEYAQRHDEGLAGMTKRSFMWLSKTGLDRIIDQTQKWLLEGID